MIYCAKFHRDRYTLVFNYLSDPSEITLQRGREELIYCLPEYPDPVIIAVCTDEKCASAVVVSGEPFDIYMSNPGELDFLEEEERRNWKKIHMWWATKAQKIIAT